MQSNPTIVAYAVVRQAWENPGSGCDTVRCLLSDGSITTEAHHPSEHWPYFDRFCKAKVYAPAEFWEKIKLDNGAVRG